MRDYIHDWAKLMASIFYGITWIAIILLSMALIVALPILVVALVYYMLTIIFGVAFSWYIAASVGLFILFAIGIGL